VRTVQQLASQRHNGIESAAAEQRQRSTVGRNIHDSRVQAGLTQEQLADRLGVTQEVVSRWERGRRMPRAEALEAISELFGHGDTAWLYETDRGK